MVVNGDQLQRSKHCTRVPLALEHTEFLLGFHVLTINTAKIVVRVQWLKTLAPALVDYSN